MNPNLDTSFKCSNFDVTDNELSKIDDVNESLNKIVKDAIFVYFSNIKITIEY